MKRLQLETTISIYFIDETAAYSEVGSACSLRQAIALAFHYSRKINLTRTKNKSPSYEKSLAPSQNNVHVVISDLKNSASKMLPRMSARYMVWSISLAAQAIAKMFSWNHRRVYICTILNVLSHRLVLYIERSPINIFWPKKGIESKGKIALLKYFR